MRHHLTGRSYTVPYCAPRRYPFARHGRYPFSATRTEAKYIYEQHQNGYPGVGSSTPALYLFELDHDFKQEDRKAAYTPAVGYWVKECSKDRLVLERFEVNTDGPNLLEGDVTFRRMGLYTK